MIPWFTINPQQLDWGPYRLLMDELVLVVSLSFIAIGIASLTGVCSIDTRIGWMFILTSIPIGIPLSLFKTCTNERKPIDYLTVSHFMAQWTDRTWQIAVPLIFMDLFKTTLMPTALYSTAVYLFVIITLPRVGSWVDSDHRLWVQQVSNVIENVCAIVTALMFCVMVLIEPTFGDTVPQWDSQTVLLFTLILLLGCVGELMNNASTLAVERDWVVVIAASSGQNLAVLNACLRRVDLFTKILAPASFSVVYSLFDEPRDRIFYTGVSIGIWNLLSFPVEYVFNRKTFDACPSLDHKIHMHIDGTRHAHTRGEKPHIHVGTVDHVTGVTYLSDQPIEPSNIDKVISLHAESFLVGYVARKNMNASFLAGWKIYRSQISFLANLAYTALWMTVLDNGALMTSYFQWRGIPAFYLGISRGIGAFFGLVGTYLYGSFKKKLDAEYTGAFAIVFFAICLTPTLVTGTQFLDSFVVDLCVLAAVSVSRMGLWMFDLAITEICQEHVKEEHRAVHGSIQTACYQLFYVFIQVLTIINFRPEDFGNLVRLSCIVVYSAVAVYVYWVLVKAPVKHQVASFYGTFETVTT